MNHLPIISSFEIKTSRTEQKVPVVNGIHLHSIYNPNKEAENLINGHMMSFEGKNEVLILGLGFGYHINYAIEKLTELYGSNFKIIVIEPNLQVHQECMNLDLLNKKNVLVYSGFTANELYSDLDLIHFLLRKPAMIAHPASFNLYQAYFKTFLTFEAPTNMEEIVNFTETKEVKNYLHNFDSNITFEDAIYGQVPKKPQFTSMDFLAMAMVEMTKKSQDQSSGEAE
jgi:hypothetical protein